MSDDYASSLYHCISPPFPSSPPPPLCTQVMQPCIEELQQAVSHLHSAIKCCTSRAKVCTEAVAGGELGPGDPPQRAPRKKALYIEVALDVK